MQIAFWQGRPNMPALRIFSSFSSAVSSAVPLLLDAVFPPRCVSCQSWLETARGSAPHNPADQSSDTDELFCANCESALVRLRAPLCECCGNVDEWEHPSHRCADCRARPPAFTALRSLYDFSGGARDAVHALKYHGRTAFARPLAARLALLCNDDPIPRNCIPIAVPLHPWRRWRRGFNQSELLAHEIEKCLQVRSNLKDESRSASRILRRVRWTSPQVELDEQHRAANVRGAFAADGRALAQLPPLPILLVDDVATTGATLDECARALKGAGASQVFAVTVARRI